MKARLDAAVRARIIIFLLEKPLLPLERARMLRGWVHSGFNVHRSNRVQPHQREDHERFAQYIIRNPFSDLTVAHWHPLTMLSHMLDAQLWGPRAGRHLMVNLALHAANAALLFLLLGRLTRAWTAAWIAAALFAAHPLNVETVAWVSQRKSLLSALFFFLTLGAYARYAKDRSRAWYTAALGLYTLGLMAKPMLVTLPFVLLLLDGWPLERLAFPLDWRRVGACVTEKIPFFALAAMSSIVTYHFQRVGGAIVETAAMDVRARVLHIVWS